MNKKLYVGNLLYEVTDEELKDMFAGAGAVVSTQIIRFRDTGRSKGFGFVEMSSPEEAKKATEMWNGKELDGRVLAVNEARPMQPRTGGGYGGGGQGNRGDSSGGRDW